MRGIAVFPQPDAALLHLRGGALPCGAIGAATLDSDGRAALMASDPNPRPAKPPFWRVCPPLLAARRERRGLFPGANPFTLCNYSRYSTQ